MIALGEHTKVYLAGGATDMRKSIDGLAGEVADVLGADPFSSHLFVFCNRGRDKLKILFWQRNGFWLWYRRLERERFVWPQPSPGQAAVEISARQLAWLLDGLPWQALEGHRRANRSVV
jgi:transposase